MIVSHAPFDAVSESRPLSAGAVVAAAMLPFSLLLVLVAGLVTELPGLLALPLIGIGGASFGARSIRKAAGELGGRRLAGIAACGHAVMLLGAVGWNVYLDRIAHPSGYRSISFARLNRSPEEIASLVGQNVVIGGWMLPTSTSSGIPQFTLVDHLENNFGTYYKSHQQVFVRLQKHEAIDYRSSFLVVTGALREFDRSHGCPAGDCPAYTIDADSVRVAPLPLN